MNVERLNKLLEDIDNALYDLKVCQCNINVTAKRHKWETYYGLDDDLIKYIRKIESSNKNLQSKIDKVNEFIDGRIQILTVSVDNKAKDEYFNNKCIGGIQELKNVKEFLKEDK